MARARYESLKARIRELEQRAEYAAQAAAAEAQRNPYSYRSKASAQPMTLQ